MSAPALSSESAGYAQRRKQLHTLTRDLHAAGAHIHLDLPRIVVIGNQSAGKSSVIEAISEIKVPRDVGTCTRCPMECRVLESASGKWSCQIKIRWEYDPAGRRKHDVEEILFGGLLTDKADVELMLKRAQAAVVDAGKTPLGQILNMSPDDLTAFSRSFPATTFSRNVVCVDITGPGLTDLSFVDLPGIISNADPAVVQFVQNMVQSYISGTCLIVVALPMSDDIENQSALRMAREVDRDGSRTIGVMTKPDTLSPGSIKAKNLWLEILEGRAQGHRLRHGYYCTRQPDDGERTTGITSAEAREAERRFFESTGPWSTSTEQQRFGTGNLVKYLSKMLTEIINKVLPRLQHDVEQKLSACCAGLRKIPKEVTNEPASYVLGLLSSFCVDIQSHVVGVPGAEVLVQHNRRTYGTFKRAIRSTAPRFIPLPSASDAPSNAIRVDVLSDPEDDETIENDSPPGIHTQVVRQMYLKDMRTHIQRSTTRELPFNVPYPAKTTLIRRFQKTWEDECISCFENIQRHFRLTLSQLINRRFQRFKNLAGKIDAAIVSLLQDCRAAALEQIGMLLKFETTPFTQNTHYLSDATDKVLSRYKDVRGSRSFVRSLPEVEVAAEEVDGTEDFYIGQSGHSPVPESPPLPPSPDNRAETPRAPEFDLPQTTASVFENTEANPRNAGTSHTARIPHFTLDWSDGPSIPSETQREQQMAEALAALARVGYTGLTADDLGKLKPPDEYEEELKVMAEVRAYFQVSYKRIIDYIPLAIDHTFLYAFAEALQFHLIENLALGAPDAAARCTAYLSEDLDIVMRRQELTGRKASLEKAKLELMSVSFAGVELSASS
ncbi:P-loop containing nucleoside triphosphate hydrolase protein [Rhodofomes roseus]|uniref:P-loop containing nucleoside triphosphate hydrolase protein n=1 Tax=Rhodofomes roseus TaxID=34475 RepID=A0ABQ8KX79_9APHY|nr:P-loop containing nucleoside triphosphate hydrolase protein [Rhodofomes roseus]KAH9843658.1 P-loop containing nucleoside triphosphate hydrolase protein [Rhodofomes roseus]